MKEKEKERISFFFFNGDCDGWNLSLFFKDFFLKQLKKNKKVYSLFFF